MNAVTRTLKLRQNGTERDVPVCVFWPTKHNDAWNCRWEIDWPDRQRSNLGRGVDAVQALVQALRMIGAEIYCSEEHASGRLLWEDGWVGYGFPVPGNIRDVLARDDGKYF